ncbi:rRNA pseudouridine synthase [bacterium]|nr:rRNA pseudouridine synthase [bacterium]
MKNKVTPNSKYVRLQKYCSEQGLLSRREAETYIKNGWISVNGEVATLGQKVHSERDKIIVNGPSKRKTYVKYYKSTGIVTNCAQKDEKQISNVIEKKYRQLSAIGRLDKESEGLILLSDDGLFAKSFLDPNNEHEREYFVRLDRPYPGQMMEDFYQGVVVLGQRTKSAKMKRLSDTTFLLTLKEGKNRQIRRMVEAYGCEVIQLKRIRIGVIEVDKMRPNQALSLSKQEVDSLLKMSAQ